MNHTYQQTHPWLTFNLKIGWPQLNFRTWLILGEIISKADHIKHAPLKPEFADQLYRIYLSKGIHATTSIEGNSLTEQQVNERINNRLPLPESTEYQGKEIDNLLSLMTDMLYECKNNTLQPLSVEKISEYNKRILKDQITEPEVIPGQLRNYGVEVGKVYKGAPAKELPELMDKYIDFINNTLQTDDEQMMRPVLVLRAIMAHLYFAWIHPFGDGNGRTARLIESQLLYEAGFPSSTVGLLSDHYNRTRSQYYHILRDASAPTEDNISTGYGHGVCAFINYALQGLLEGIREQIEHIEAYYLQLSWNEYVHDVFATQPKTEAQHRRLALALQLESRPQSPTALVAKDEQLLGMYLGQSERVLRRDIGALKQLGLAIPHKDGYIANVYALIRMLPVAQS